MSELEQLANLIQIILSGDNEKRKEAEALLQSSKASNINTYVSAFLELLQGNHHQLISSSSLQQRTREDFLRRPHP